MTPARFRRVALALAFATALPVVPMAVPGFVVSVEARQGARMKGTLKSIDATSAVVVPSDNKKAEITFEITPTTERSGALAAGAQVEVVYVFADSKRVAKQLIGKGK